MNHQFPPDITEIDAETYNRLVRPMTANDYLAGMERAPRQHSSTVNTETPAKVEFGQWLELVSPHPVEREYRGIAGRRFAFDWAIPGLKLAFEYDGRTDHATVKGSERDAVKGNLAQLNGWLFIRLNAASLNDGSGYETAMQAFALRGVEVSK